MTDFFGVAPWVVVTSVVTWAGSALMNARKIRGEERRAELESGSKLEIHRDELTFELLTNARAEMAAARAEIGELRTEVTHLRGLEQHMFHFEQSLDHLEAMLIADTPEQRKSAERNARAFLNRMRRLATARGTITNEIQRVDSSVSLAERSIKDM